MATTPRRGGRMNRAKELAAERNAREAAKPASPSRRPDFGIDEGMKARQRGTSVAGMAPPSPRAPARPTAPARPAKPAKPAPAKPERRMTDAEISAWNAKRGNATVNSYTRPKGQGK